ncbi:hypothetical protein L209DRAFT_759307 [Thermothelomyces heterothallicus CBS 203.75]
MMQPALAPTSPLALSPSFLLLLLLLLVVVVVAVVDDARDEAPPVLLVPRAQRLAAEHQVVIFDGYSDHSERTSHVHISSSSTGVESVV